MKLLIVLSITSALALAQDDSASQRNAEIKALEQQLNARKTELNKLRVQYTEAHPTVRAAEARLREQESTLELLLKGKGSPPEMWWKDARYRTLLGVSSDQQTKIDDIFQQYRLKLVDLNAALQKEEITLDPLIAASQLDEAKAASQIDRVAQARAELEKARGRMLLGMRKVLTADQWKKLSDFSNFSK